MMFPMIATIDEIRSVKGLVAEERAKLADAIGEPSTSASWWRSRRRR
jgi:phosphoenolpyruvate-protein kinase (PTS system EI component)